MVRPLIVRPVRSYRLGAVAETPQVVVDVTEPGTGKQTLTKEQMQQMFPGGEAPGEVNFDPAKMQALIDADKAKSGVGTGMSLGLLALLGFGLYLAFKK